MDEDEVRIGIRSILATLMIEDIGIVEALRQIMVLVKKYQPSTIST